MRVKVLIRAAEDPKVHTMGMGTRRPTRRLAAILVAVMAVECLLCAAHGLHHDELGHGDHHEVVGHHECGDVCSRIASPCDCPGDHDCDHCNAHHHHAVKAQQASARLDLRATFVADGSGFIWKPRRDVAPCFLPEARLSPGSLLLQQRSTVLLI